MGKIYCKGSISLDTLPLTLTVAEAGEVLRIGRSSTYALVRCGRLRSIRVGKMIRVPRDAIVEFLSA
jgi:excisionase family DNA binding protein